MIATALLVTALAASRGDEVVARVDASSITASAYGRRVASLSPGDEALSPNDIVNGLVTETLLAREAERLGLRTNPEVAARLDAATRRIALELMVEKDLAAKVRPSDAELREMFHSTADYARYDLVVFATRDEAAAAADRVRKGAKLEDVARGAVVSRVAKDGGDAAPVIRAQMEPALAKAVFAASPGAVAGPVQAANGFALVRVLEKVVGDDAAFAARRASLAEYAKKQSVQQMKKHLAGQLAAKAKVSIDEPFLRGLSGSQATPADLDHVLAKVNGRPLRYRDIYDAVRYLGGGHMAGPDVKIQLAQNQVETMLLEDLAIERGFAKDAQALPRIADAERETLATAATGKIAASAGPPSEAEIEAYYRANQARYGKAFEDVLPAVVADAARQKRADTVRARVAELRKTANVRIYEDALARAAEADGR